MKINYRDIPKDLKKAFDKAEMSKAMRFYPIFLLYSVTVILLVKLLLILI